jgi:hypothetical protein
MALYGSVHVHGIDACATKGAGTASCLYEFLQTRHTERVSTLQGHIVVGHGPCVRPCDTFGPLRPTVNAFAQEAFVRRCTGKGLHVFIP